MKRLIPLLLTLLLLTSCGGKEKTPDREPSSSRSDPGAGQSSQVQAGEPDRYQADPSEELLAIATDFAESFDYAFPSPEYLYNVERFCLLKIYYEDPEAISEGDGHYWVDLDRLEGEVRRRFDFPSYRFQSPESEDVYPRYVEERGAVGFYLAGGGNWFTAVLVGHSAEGEYYDYTFDLYDDVISDEHPEPTLAKTLRYRFRVTEAPDGSPFLQAVSAVDLTPEPEPEPEPEPAPQPDTDPDQRPLYFSLGPQGEAQPLLVGDTLGDWTLQSRKVDWDRGEFDGVPWVDGARFTAPDGAPVELRCSVSLDTLSLPSRSYEFFVEEEDLDKLPVLEHDGRDVWFTADNSGDLTALADLGEKERRYCRVAVSSYNVVCIPMMSSNGAHILRLELE